jgi:trans-aconitate methyltransferase
MGRWFGGDRTVEQQFTGLDALWPLVAGKKVLDLGCAEGDIAIECARRGAASVLGLEVRNDAVQEARAKAKRLETAKFSTCDLNTWVVPRMQSDVILMLAILHKLKHPADFLGRVLDRAAARSCTVVLRTRRSDWPVLHDARSGFRPQDIRFAMYDRGFTLVHEDDGPIDSGQPAEWVGFFERDIA